MASGGTPQHPGVLIPLVVALAILSLASPAFGLEQKLTASDGAAGDRLGVSVAIEGDTLVVGAPFDDTGANINQGAVYVYQRTGDGSAQTWAQTAKLTASDGSGDDLLGGSVDIDGDTIVAGAPYDDAPMDPEAGSVYTFARTGPATRTETAKLTLVDGVIEEYLGQSVGIDGDTIVAGAPGDFSTNEDQGAVYTFTRSGAAARTETARLTAADGDSIDRLGESVGIDGDTIVAGAPYHNIGADSSQGSVYTFARAGGDRTQTAKLTTYDGGLNDNLGSSVAIDGDTIVAGLGTGGGPGPIYGRGAAYTFARSGIDRTETAKLIASDGTADDTLGETVAIDGPTIVVGARYADFGALGEVGAAYMFSRTGPALRTETARLNTADSAADDEFGASVAIDGPTILAGAQGDDVGANEDQGSITVFTPAGPDMTAPKTKGLEGPKKVERGKRIKFRFKSTEPDSTFSCKLDRKKFKACRSPKSVNTAKLKFGRHTFSVFATDAAGNDDPSPAKVRFKIVRGGT